MNSLSLLFRSGFLAVSFALATSAWAGTLGKVVSIGGHASDLALDEARGVLYIANFTGNRIDVMSLADQTIQRSINVAAQPGSMAVSPDGRYLVATHYGNFTAPNSPNNALTTIDLATGSRQTYSMGNPPLGVAFGIDGKALVVTSTAFISFDPTSGAMETIETVATAAAKALPQPQGQLPSQIVATSLGVSGDGVTIYGLTDTFYFRYDSNRKVLRGGGYTASPTMGPRAVSVSRDGSYWMSGWSLNDADFWSISQFPNASGALNIGSVQIDSSRNLVYAQVGEVGVTKPILHVMDADNLTVREKYNLAENLSGKSVMSSDNTTMYSVSESGVTIFPVGALNREARIVVGKKDVVFRSNFCDRNIAIQEVSIGNDGDAADFQISSSNPGVRVTPSSGMTPATVRISVDPSTFQGQKGTVAVDLKISSSTAVNDIPPVRVLVNSREPDQRGNSVNIEGKLVDLMADPERDRFFILRQDTNEVLVFDGTTYTQVASLRTFNRPKSMAITFDRRYLLVGADNSHFLNVYDLETLQPGRPILIGDYVQSVAASSRAILAATRSATGGDNKIHRTDLGSRASNPLPTLGVYQNKIVVDTVLTAAPNGRSILIAQADGNLMLYNAIQDTFTISRKETTPLTGAYAASNSDQYVVGGALLNSSLVPMRRMEENSGKSSGFAFLDSQIGFRFNAPSASAPGILQRVDLGNGSGIRPTRTSEAPLLATTTEAFTRTIAPLASRAAVIGLTISGFTVFPWEYDTATAPPRIDRVVNAADGAQPVAPGALISVTGSDLSPVSQSSRQIPLPTVLGESCLTVNGIPVPVMFVSPRQINAQLPYNVDGATTLVLRTPGGVSDNFNLTILQAAPSVFRTASAGPQTGIPTVIRANNNQPVTLSNPIHRGDTLTIYATGLGRTSPAVETGVPAPLEPLASVSVPPNVTIGNVPVEVLYAGLTPGEIGIYQINVRTNAGVPLGMNVSLEIRQAGNVTSVPVRVVD